MKVLPERGLPRHPDLFLGTESRQGAVFRLQQEARIARGDGGRPVGLEGPDTWKDVEKHGRFGPLFDSRSKLHQCVPQSFQVEREGPQDFRSHPALDTEMLRVHTGPGLLRQETFTRGGFGIGEGRAGNKSRKYQQKQDGHGTVQIHHVHETLEAARVPHMPARIILRSIFPWGPLSIFRMPLYCLSRRLTSWTEVPEP